ncbi:hypothetical protein BSKO_08507 [Bryopsis sp. KO-2023]|nr:hypothetical protein BSKO_08507 [Bryopsis sp. KO-2023]
MSTAPIIRHPFSCLRNPGISHRQANRNRAHSPETMSSEGSPVRGSATTEEGNKAHRADLAQWCEWFVGSIRHEATSAWDRLTRWAPTTTDTSTEVKFAIREDEGTSSQPHGVGLDVQQDQAGEEDGPGGFGSEQEPQPSEVDGEGSSDEEGAQAAGPSRKRRAEDGALQSEGKKLKGAPPSPEELSPRKRKRGEEVRLQTEAQWAAFDLDANDCATSESTGVESLAGEDMDANDVVVSSVRVSKRRAVFNWRTDHLKEPGYTRGSLNRFRQAVRKIKKEDEEKDADPEAGKREPRKKRKAPKKPKKEKKPAAPKREPTRRQPSRRASAKVSYAESD